MVHGLSRNCRDFDPLALYVTAKLGLSRSISVLQFIRKATLVSALICLGEVAVIFWRVLISMATLNTFAIRRPFWIRLTNPRKYSMSEPLWVH